MSIWEAVIYTGEQWWVKSCTEPLFAPKLFALLILVVDLIRRRGRFSWPDQAIRSCIANIAMVLANGAFGPCLVFFTIWAQATYDNFGFPHLDTSVWSQVPTWMLVLIVVLTSDFADYWNHRWLHSKWLWPIHSIHHSDPYVTVLTTGRVHVLEPIVMRLSYVILLSWLGMPPDVLGGGVALLMLHNMYVHINVDWHHGPLKYIIASPRFHRWHHANTPEAFDKNLANVFPFYDILFGTYYCPGTCLAEMGTARTPTKNPLKLLLWPFVEWDRMSKAAFKRVKQKFAFRRSSQAVAK